MRAVALFSLSALACAAHLACGGADCGDGTVERDGVCVASGSAGGSGGAGGTDFSGNAGGSGGISPAACQFDDRDVERKCYSVCSEPECTRRCSARAQEAGACACQACLVESYGYYPDSASISAVQETCVPYCSGRVRAGPGFATRDVERKCYAVCVDEEPVCVRRCDVRADGAGSSGCQACLIESYAHYPVNEAILAAQEACLPYCIE